MEAGAEAREVRDGGEAREVGEVGEAREVGRNENRQRERESDRERERERIERERIERERKRERERERAAHSKKTTLRQACAHPKKPYPKGFPAAKKAVPNRVVQPKAVPNRKNTTKREPTQAQEAVPQKVYPATSRHSTVVFPASPGRRGRSRTWRMPGGEAGPAEPAARREKWEVLLGIRIRGTTFWCGDCQITRLPLHRCIWWKIIL